MPEQYIEISKFNHTIAGIFFLNFKIKNKKNKISHGIGNSLRNKVRELSFILLLSGIIIYTFTKFMTRMHHATLQYLTKLMKKSSSPVTIH